MNLSRNRTFSRQKSLIQILEHQSNMKLFILIVLILTLFVCPISAQINQPKTKITLSNSCSLPKAIKFEVVTQRKVENKSNNIWARREIEFRLINVSNCPIFVRGTKADKFYPLSFTIEFDKRKKQWFHAAWGNKIPEFKNLGVSEPENFLLNPTEILTFTKIMEDSALKHKHKEIIYISLGSADSEVKDLQSPEFLYSPEFPL